MMNIGYFNSEIAQKFGVIEATFLQMLYRIIRDNKDACIIEDGAFWFPCAIKEWENYIKLWSPRQIDRIAKNCLLNHTLMMRHYDMDERRRRSWYAINTTIVSYLEETEQIIKSKW